MWEFNDIWQYGDFTNTFTNLASTGTYYQWLLWSVQPTINTMYDQVLTNPIFMGLLVVLLVLSLFIFRD